MSPVRDYAEITRRVGALSGSGWTADVYGAVAEMPLHMVAVEEADGERPWVLVSGGVHGDEPAGVEAALRFLEARCDGYIARFRFLAAPCVNPTGYAANRRENGAGLDINRAFDGLGATEADALKSSLKGRRFACAVDFHEDWETSGFYMYEGVSDRAEVGTQVVERVARIGQMDEHTDPADPPIVPGVYPVSMSWGTVGLAPYLLANHTPHVVITETPSTAWDLDRRVDAHLAALGTVLRAHLG